MSIFLTQQDFQLLDQHVRNEQYIYGNESSYTIQTYETILTPLLNLIGHMITIQLITKIKSEEYKDGLLYNIDPETQTIYLINANNQQLQLIFFSAIKKLQNIKKIHQDVYKKCIKTYETLNQVAIQEEEEEGTNIKDNKSIEEIIDFLKVNQIQYEQQEDYFILFKRIKWNFPYTTETLVENDTTKQQQQQQQNIVLYYRLRSLISTFVNNND